MYRKLLFICITITALIATLFGGAFGIAAQVLPPQQAQVALGSGFTYQGQLKQNGAAVNAACDMAFRLYDTVSDGAQVGNAIKTLTASETARSRPRTRPPA